MFKIHYFITLFAVIFMGCGSQHRETLIIAHRGASGDAPENTIASALLAFEQGSDGTEIDIYLSKDNRLIVIHDKSTMRTTGVDLQVEQSYSHQLRQLDAGSFKSEDYAGEKIPYFEEIAELIPEGKLLYIDVKSGPQIVPFLHEAMVNSGKIDRMVIIAFEGDVLIEAKKVMPDVPMYWLKRGDRDRQTREYLPYDDSVIEYAVANGFDGVSLHFASLDKDFIERANSAGLEVHTWTVNNVEQAKRVLECGVLSITTDYPQLIIEGLGL